MIVPGVTSTEAQRYIVAFLRDEDPKLESFEIGLRDRPAWTTIAKALDVWLEAEAEEFLDRQDEQARYEFDALAAEGIHRILKIPAFVAASPDFWRYLNVTHLRRFLIWRHGVDDHGQTKVAPVNFGNGTPKYDLSSRLWFRGELGHAPDREDPYELVRRGGTDFWASGFTRRLYPSARNLAHALIELRHPEPGQFTGNQYHPQTLDTDQTRELYKRLRHYDAIVSFASLSAPEARDFLQSIAADLLPD